MLIRPVSQAWETWKWVVALVFAVVLGMLFATVVGAAPVGRTEPETLPNELREAATPMPGVEIRGTDQFGRQVWQILDLHRTRQHELAVTTWKKLEVPPEIAVWKWIAMGQAFLAEQRFDEAEQTLGRAIEMQPDNALAFYLRGVLRMQQAYVAREWPDTVGARPTRLVGYTPQQVVPNTRSLYELAAAMDFERAIDLAPMLELNTLLVPIPARGIAIEPTVGDLVLAIGAENFPAKAHNALSYLFLKQGALELAEQHMDDAAKGGLAVVYGYQDLGDEYQARGQYVEATRAYLKATKFAGNKRDTLEDAMRTLWKAFLTP